MIVTGEFIGSATTLSRVGVNVYCRDVPAFLRSHHNRRQSFEEGANKIKAQACVCRLVDPRYSNLEPQLRARRL